MSTLCITVDLSSETFFLKVLSTTFFLFFLLKIYLKLKKNKIVRREVKSEKEREAMWEEF